MANRILLADDSITIQKVVNLTFADEGIEVVAVSNGDQAERRLADVQPDLVLADISLPDKNGLELIKDVQSVAPGLPVLVISIHDESLHAERVLRAGGRGYIMKQEGGKKLMQAIRKVLSGQIYLSEKMSAKILELFSGRRAEAESTPVGKLTDLEFEVFQLIGQGKSTKEIAAGLHLSPKTVEVHRINIKQKLSLKSAPELIRYAVRWIESGSSSGR